MAWIYKETYGYGGLTQSEMENNANIIAYYFQERGASLEAICGMLGNMEHESGLNPMARQREGRPDLGAGLIQWTPATILYDWLPNQGYQWYDGDGQLWRIWCEGYHLHGATGWLPTASYPYTFDAFLHLTSVYEATAAYFYERERGPAGSFNTQYERAARWYEYFSGHPPTPPELDEDFAPHMMLLLSFFAYLWH